MMKKAGGWLLQRGPCDRHAIAQRTDDEIEGTLVLLPGRTSAAIFSDSRTEGSSKKGVTTITPPLAGINAAVVLSDLPPMNTGEVFERGSRLEPTALATFRCCIKDWTFAIRAPCSCAVMGCTTLGEARSRLFASESGRVDLRARQPVQGTSGHHPERGHAWKLSHHDSPLRREKWNPAGARAVSRPRIRARHQGCHGDLSSRTAYLRDAAAFRRRL